MPESITATATAAEQTTLALFPLYTVLVPGAALGLRVFEPRYLDLVRDCGRNGSTFGINLILKGQEAGAAATPASYGTEAVIEDFDRDADGLLSLRVRGMRRFHVRRTRVRDNGLVLADIDWVPDDPQARLRPEHALLADVLLNMLEQAGADLLAVEKSQIENAVWVGWRLAEMLPLTDIQRQCLLQDQDPHQRLQWLLDYVS